MKKIFTFLGIAVLATSLMTACGDEEENNDALADGTYRIEKGTATTWDAAAIEAVDFTAQNYITLNCQNTDKSVAVSGWLQCVAGTFDAETSKGDYMRYRDQNDIVQAGNQSVYNFYPNTKSWAETISAIDLTALTLSGNWSEQATTYADASANYDATNQIVNWENCTETYTLKGTMQNIHWDSWTAPSKADNAKKAFTPEIAK